MADQKLPTTISDVQTPCFLIDLEKVKKNAQKMLDICEKLNVQLRPHMKTHKTVELGVMMTNGTRRRIEVSTLQEAEFYARNGFDDILYAYPVISAKVERCKQLAYSLNTFHVMVDSNHGLQALLQSPLEGGKKWSVYMEIDNGLGRTGIPWDSEDAIILAEKLDRSDAIEFQGLYLFDGNAYSVRGKDELEKIGKGGQNVLTTLCQRLADKGVKCKRLCIGCTPSCSHPDTSMKVLTEFHPGNYIFYDAMQVIIGSCTKEEVACRVATRIIGHKPFHNTLLIDCGFLALSHDGMKTNPDDFSTFQDNPDFKITNLSQEIGIVTTKSGNKIDFTRFPIGSQLFIYPWHSCATACQHTTFYVHSGDKIVDTWTPTKGW